MVAAPRIRKRITRVGSGAFSVYLPKKWVDRWSHLDPQRGVELVELGQGMLILPINREREVQLTLPDDVDLVSSVFVRAFVQGADRVKITPANGKFGAGLLATVRALIRRLETDGALNFDGVAIVWECKPNPNDAPVPTSRVLDAILDRTRVLGRAVLEALTQHGKDVEGFIEGVRYARDILRDDVLPVRDRTLRRVARLEIDFQTISELQLLSFQVESIHRVAELMVGILEELLVSSEVSVELIDYPVETLAPRLLAGPWDLSASGREMRQLARDYLEELFKFLESKDWSPATLAQTGEDAELMARRAQDSIGEVIRMHWGTELGPVEAAQLLQIYRCVLPVEHALREIAHLGRAISALGVA